VWRMLDQRGGSCFLGLMSTGLLLQGATRNKQESRLERDYGGLLLTRTHPVSKRNNCRESRSKKLEELSSFKDENLN